MFTSPYVLTIVWEIKVQLSEYSTNLSQMSISNMKFENMMGDLSFDRLQLQTFIASLDGFHPRCEIFVIQTWYWRRAGIVSVSMAELSEVRDLIWPEQMLKAKDYGAFWEDLKWRRSRVKK